MTTQSNNVRAVSMDTLSATTLTIGSNATNISIGGASSKVIMGNIANVNTLATRVFNITTTSHIVTLENIFTNGMTYVLTYSSANPSTVNDIITITLPTPDASIEGMYFVFRKLRGFVNTSTTNVTFNCDTPSILSGTVSLTSSANPAISTLSNSGPTTRWTVLGFGGAYYWTLS